VISHVKSMIESTSNSDRTARVGHTPTQASKAKNVAPGRDKFNSAQADTLREALARTPEVRPEVVERGKQLAADPNYPSPDILSKVAEIILRSPDPTEE
jgi:hypothetical protein